MDSKILVVDDARTVRMYHSNILTAAGYQTDEAANGFEALEKVLEERYLLLVVDVNMPQLDGHELVRRIRSGQVNSTVPIVMVSTGLEQHDVADAYASGANLYFPKPVTATELLSAVSLLVGAIQPPEVSAL